MRVYVNGEVKDLEPETSLLDLLTDLNLKPERIAAELNGQVVPRAAWPATKLTDADRIEIVHFVGGGSECLLVFPVLSVAGDRAEGYDPLNHTKLKKRLGVSCDFVDSVFASSREGVKLNTNHKLRFE